MRDVRPAGTGAHDGAAEALTCQRKTLTFLRKSVRSRRSAAIGPRDLWRTKGGPMFGFAPFVRDPKVDECRRNPTVAKPVLYVGDVPVRIREMDADRVTKDVNMASIGWQKRCGGICAEEPIDLSTRERTGPMAATPEKIRRPLRTFLEVTRQQLLAAWVERVRARKAMLSACDPNLIVSHVFELEQPRFRPA